jgi:hypothetical protein
MATLKNTIINDTGYLQLPTGTTAQRPSSVATGMMRQNSTTGLAEYYNGSQWISFTTIPYITTGLVLYVDAGITSSYPGTGTTWTDLSPSALNFTMSEGAPTFVSDGTGKYFTNWNSGYFSAPSTYGNFIPVGSADRTCISIANTGSAYTSPLEHVLQYGASSTSAAFSIAGTSTGLLTTHPWSGAPTDGSFSLNTLYMLTTQYVSSTTDNYGYVNTTGQSMGARALSTGAGDTCRIGSRINASTERWNNDGKIYAVMIYNRVLTSTEITQTYNYFKTSRGLPLA